MDALDLLPAELWGEVRGHLEPSLVGRVSLQRVCKSLYELDRGPLGGRLARSLGRELGVFSWAPLGRPVALSPAAPLEHIYHSIHTRVTDFCVDLLCGAEFIDRTFTVVDVDPPTARFGPGWARTFTVHVGFAVAIAYPSNWIRVILDLHGCIPGGAATFTHTPHGIHVAVAATLNIPENGRFKSRAHRLFTAGGGLYIQ